MPAFHLHITAARVAAVCLATALAAGCSKKLKSGTAQLAEPDPGALAVTGVSHDGWCGHLGSARDGRSDESLANNDWAEREPQQLWQAKLGTGAAGVAVHGGRVYGIGNDGGEDTVSCLDAETGQPLWSISYPCALDQRQFEGGPAATPTLDPAGGRLFVLSHEGELRCLDIADGSERWRKHLVEDFAGRRPKWGYSNAPLLAKGLLVVEPGGDGSSLVALDAASGDERWRAGDDKPGYGAPVVFPHGDKPGVGVFNAHGLVGYDLDNGGALFRFRWKTSYDVNASTPCYHAGHFFICSGYGKGGGLVSVQGGDPELVYETRDAVSQFQSPVRVGDYLYLVSGDNSTKSRLVCLRFVDGTLAWSESVGGNRGNVIAVDGQLITVSERGEAILCKASPERFTEGGRFQAIGGRVWAPPAFAGGLLFVRNNAGELRAWDLR